MRNAIRAASTMVFVAIVVLCLPSGSWAQAEHGLSVDLRELVFGDRDIGTVTTKTLFVKNGSNGPANLTISIDGANANNFSSTSSCAASLPTGSRCEIKVLFGPLDVAGTPDRQAQLTVSGGDLTAPPVSLHGSAFQNLGTSALDMIFDDQPVNTSSPTHSLLLTNYSTLTVNNIAVTAAGDFTESHAKCEKIGPGASCAISVVFAPKSAGAHHGSLTISADPSTLGKLPRIVTLHGDAMLRCSAVRVSLCSWSVVLVISVGGLYFAGLVLVRWHMIAKPARGQVVAQISAVRARLMAETGPRSIPPIAPGQAPAERVTRIHYLLDQAVYPFKNKNFPFEKDINGNEISLIPGYFPRYTRFYNALFWPRGQELAAWTLAHEAELELVALLPPDRVRARMETAEQELRVINTPVSLALADRLRDEAGSTPMHELRSQALLAEALGIVYESGDTAFFQLATWHSKMIWLVGCALLFILALAATLQNSVLLLLGAVGGLLSRLTRTIRSADVANDYGASWGALFLSPLSGALSAWGGILLVVLGRNFNILGPAVSVDWCNPYEPSTLAIALLLGFSERLFDGMASQIEDKFLKTPPTSPSPAPPAPGPTISSVTPSPLNSGSATLKVKGVNFQHGATATVTNESEVAIAVDLVVIDSASATVTAMLTGDKARTVRLTITNPDKRSASFNIPFEVT